jgi:mRNA interferase YafQ
VRRIERHGKYRRDLKREATGRYRATLESDLVDVLLALRNDQPLAPNFHDHALTGHWKGHRECHIKPDLLLIYRKTDDQVLQLVRLGSHSELNL